MTRIRNFLINNATFSYNLNTDNISDIKFIINLIIIMLMMSCIYFTSFYMLTILSRKTLLVFIIYLIYNMSWAFTFGLIYYIIIFSLVLLTDFYQQKEYYLLSMIFKLIFCILTFILVIYFSDTNYMMAATPFITFFNKVKSTISKEKGDQFKHWLNNLLNTDYKDRKLTGEDIRIIHRRSTIYLMENNPDLKDSNLLTVSDFLKNNNLLSDSCKEEDGFVNLPDSPTLQKIVELNKNLVDVASSNSMLTNGKGRIESFGNNTLLKDLDVVFDINKGNTPTIQLNNQPITEEVLTPITEEASSIVNDLDVNLLSPTKYLNNGRASSKYEGVNLLDPTVTNISNLNIYSKTYRRIKEYWDLPEIPLVDDIIESLGNRSNPSAPVSPMSSDIWDTCSTSSVNSTTFPSSNRDTIDSIRSNLNNSELSFNSNIVEPSQSTESLNKIDPLISEINEMLVDSHKPYLNEDQTKELVRKLKKKALKGHMIGNPYESDVNIYNLFKNKAIYLWPLLIVTSIKLIIGKLKPILIKLRENWKVIGKLILKRLIIKLIVYLILLILYKLSPYLIDTLPNFTPTDSSIISMSMEEYDQWINTLSDCNLPTYEESIFDKPLPDVPQSNIILNIINEIIDWWK